MRKSKKQFFWGATFFAILASGWVGCSKTGSTYTTTPVTYVSVMNEAPYGPTTDIYLNNQLATASSGIIPGAYSLKYGALQPGKYTIQFKKNGSSDSLTQISGTPTLDTLNFYSLIMYNDTAKATKSMLIHDDFTSISTTNVNYRFFNFSPDAPRVDFYMNVTYNGTNPGVQPLLIFPFRGPGDNVANPNYNTFISTAPSLYDLQVRNSATHALIAKDSAVNLVGGNVYTFFLYGTTNNWKLNILQASY
jgi:hypothetical protein